MDDILQKILATKKQEIAQLRKNFDKGVFEQARDVYVPRGFQKCLFADAKKGPAVIAEVKKASPSKGLIREDFDPVGIAKLYQQGGASALSVLTDKQYFMGDNSFISAISSQVDLPILRKEFVIERIQVEETLLLGADALLLIVAALSRDNLADLYHYAGSLQLDVLVEVHTVEELDIALDLGVKLIGINNRDLRSFETRTATTVELVGRLKDKGSDAFVVSESGINSYAIVQKLYQAGAGAFLIGEHFMRQANPALALQEILGKSV